MKWLSCKPIPGNADKMCKNEWTVGEHTVTTWRDSFTGPWEWTCSCGVERCVHGEAVTAWEQRWRIEALKHLD